MHILRLKWGSNYELWFDNDLQNFNMLFQDSILDTKKKPRNIFQDVEFSTQDSNLVFSITNLGMVPDSQRYEFVADFCWRRISKGWQIGQLSRQRVRVKRQVITAVQKHTTPVCYWGLLRLVQWVVDQTVVSHHSWVTEGNWTIVTDRSVMCIALTVANCVWINDRYATFMSNLTHVVFSQDSCGSFFFRGI